MGEHRHAQDGWVRVEAPLLRPWASPGDLAEEFRRRAGLSSRDLTSCTAQHGLHLLTLFCGSFRGYCMLVRAVARLARRAAVMTAKMATWQLLGFSEIFERC